jgi:PhnB protein
LGGIAVVLALDVGYAEAVFAQALAAGAQVRQPLQEAFWGEVTCTASSKIRSAIGGASAGTCAPRDEVVAAAARAFGSGPTAPW